jgi:hypothetical protein
MNYRYLKSGLILAMLLMTAVSVTHAQKQQPVMPTTGVIKGKIRVAEGGPGNISVTVRRGEREVAQTTTNSRGEFSFEKLDPGIYGLTLRKPGLQVGRVEDLKLRAGKTIDLNDKLYLQIDEGTIAFLKGSVFDKEGRSIYGARVEVVLLRQDGSTKKIGNAVTNRLGAFSFRLSPSFARYRVTAKADGVQTSSKEVQIDGAAIFRVALELVPPVKDGSN